MRVTVRSGYLLVKIKRYVLQFLHPTVQLIPVAVTGAPTRFPTNQKQGEGVAGGGSRERLSSRLSPQYRGAVARFYGGGHRSQRIARLTARAERRPTQTHRDPSHRPTTLRRAAIVRVPGWCWQVNTCKSVRVGEHIRFAVSLDGLFSTFFFDYHENLRVLD